MMSLRTSKKGGKRKSNATDASIREDVEAQVEEAAQQPEFAEELSLPHDDETDTENESSSDNEEDDEEDEDDDEDDDDDDLFVDAPADDESEEDDEESDDNDSSDEGGDGSKEPAPEKTIPLKKTGKVVVKVFDLKEGMQSVGITPVEDDIDEVVSASIRRERRAKAPKPVEDIEVVTSDSDTEDEEHSRNTLGNIPMEWYNDYEHRGYDLSGKKVRKAKGERRKDKLDKFLDRMENDGLGRTVYDPITGEEVTLSDQDIDLIKKIQAGHMPGSNPYEDYEDIFTHEKMHMPVVNLPEPKSRFIPSKWEHKKIMKIVRSIRKGRIKIGEPEKKKEPVFYDLWGTMPESRQPNLMHIPAPKEPLPRHDASYNPPPEYIPTEEEAEQWKKAHPEDREKNFLPARFDSLRHVPAYDRFVQERFSRCLDLYLCPRVRKMRMNVDPESLLPKLPDPKDLQPFPTAMSITYSGHKGKVTAIAVDPTGQWLFSGAEDNTLRIWEVTTGRCCKCINMKERINSISACPNPQYSLVAVAVEKRVYILNHGQAPKSIDTATQAYLNTPPPQGHTSARKGVTVTWVKGAANGVRFDGIAYTLEHRFSVTQVTWHRKGNYFATVMPDGSNDTVAVHSLVKQSTQMPFRKKINLVQRVLFHPSQPLFFVATRTRVRVYNLQTQTLEKKLQSGVKWISSIAVHPGGDNVIVGSYDRRLNWFDMDLSVRPYKTLRYHRFALRQVCFHSTYPLFASCSDDGSLHIFHAMVYNDLLQNPLVIPVKILKGHRRVDDLGVLDCVWHPRQPWVFSAGADGIIKLYT